MLPSIGIPNTNIFCYGIMDVKFCMINIHYFKLILMKMYLFIQKNNMSLVEREKNKLQYKLWKENKNFFKN
jgi:hypothetical protein